MRRAFGAGFESGEDGRAFFFVHSERNLPWAAQRRRRAKKRAALVILLFMEQSNMLLCWCRCADLITEAISGRGLICPSIGLDRVRATAAASSLAHKAP